MFLLPILFWVVRSHEVTQIVDLRDAPQAMIEFAQQKARPVEVQRTRVGWLFFGRILFVYRTRWILNAVEPDASPAVSA